MSSPYIITAIAVHDAIIPDYKRIRELLPKLVNLFDDDYPLQAAAIRKTATDWIALKTDSLESVDLQRLTRLIEIVCEMG